MTVVSSALRAAAELEASLQRLADVERGPDALNAVIHRDDDDAKRALRELIARGEPQLDAQHPLWGAAVLVKDNIATLQLPTSCGSKMLEGWTSPYEATAVRRLRDAGAIIVGKTNMDEFAMGSSTEHSAFGPTRNPHDRTRVPGGSSGGSAAAVASGVTRFALGSETGGSVRQPAAFCGVVGVKPTYGRVSRFGLVAFASSLDHIAVFGKRVADAAVLLDAIAGHDARDATSVAAPRLRASGAVSAAAAAPRLDGVVIGRPREYFDDALDPAIAALCHRAQQHLEARGATVRDVSLPSTVLAIPSYYVIAPAEASSNLSRFDGVRYGRREDAGSLREMYEATRSHGFGREVTRRILLGTYALSAGYYDAYYRRAQDARARIRHELERVFADGVHALLTPTTPTTAFLIGAKSDPYDMYLSDIFTVPANLAGVPAMSLPIGRANGLPVGGQLMAAHFDEETMFRVASVLEHALGEDAHR